ncbi:MAG: ABC transporter permease [Bacillota bacterium]|nr:ABC transporter permease [Bacillota bacterium]
MAALIQLVKRNSKIYFKDKTTFLTSMISPMILFLLFVTFLKSTYEGSLESIMPEGVTVENGLIDAFTGCWFLSSILGVSCVTIAFCSNILMAQDRISGSIGDLTVTPVKKSTIALSYFLSNVITTAIVCWAAVIIGFFYISSSGYTFSAAEIQRIFLDVLLCVLFGASLAALVENFIKTQGGISAVASLVSALYGFVCGAYMPISQFSDSIQTVISYLPGTYTMGILRNDYMSGVLEEMEQDVPEELMTVIKDSFDVNMYVGDTQVESAQMYFIVGGAIVVFLLLYVIFNMLSAKKKG